MIRAIHAISTFLFVTAVGLLLYNLMWQFATSGQLKLVSIEELWTSISKPGFETAKSFAESYVSPNGWILFTHSPAVAVLLVMAAVLYLPVRILMFLGFGKK